jgi:hypothetical protein
MQYLISHWRGLSYIPDITVIHHGEFRFIEIENLGEWILQNSQSYDIMVVSVDRSDLPKYRIILDDAGRRFRTR